MPSRIALGGFEIALVRGGAYYWDGGVVFGVAPKTIWERLVPCDELNRIPMGFNSYVIRTDEHTILVETGGGDKMDARSLERMKLPAVPVPLRDTLAANGIDPESVDIVVNSHLHWDHCGGNTILKGERGVPAFPRAKYFAPRGEWEHAHERYIRDKVSYIDANYDPLIDNGQMTLVDGEREIAPGVRLHPAPGHTRSMMVLTAASGGKTFCFLSDLAPMSGHLSPTWTAAFDLYPVDCIASKLDWFGRAAREQWICGFGHDPAVDFSRIRAKGEKFEHVVEGTAAPARTPEAVARS
jgi:glyoxylase-like metal-dependent hydrolase (beta-lactamase superfamily II)